MVELSGQHYLRAKSTPTKWVIGEGEKVPPDSILPVAASTVERQSASTKSVNTVQKVAFFLFIR